MKKTEIVITTTIKKRNKNLSNSKQTDIKLNKFVKSKSNYTTIKNTLLYTNCLALIKHLLRLLQQKRKERKKNRKKKITDGTV